MDNDSKQNDVTEQASGSRLATTHCSAIPPPGKYWMRNTDVLGKTQWRIVWVRLAMTSSKRECVELGREDPWSDGYLNNILKPEEWIPVISPNAQSLPPADE